MIRTNKHLKYPFGTKDPIGRKLVHKNALRKILIKYSAAITKLIVQKYHFDDNKEFWNKHKAFADYLKFWHGL